MMGKDKFTVRIGADVEEQPNRHSQRGSVTFEVSETWFSPMMSIETYYCGSRSQQEFILHKGNFQKLADFFQKAADRKWYTDDSVGQGDLDSLGRGTILGCWMDYDKPRIKIEKEVSEVGQKVDENIYRYRLKHNAIKGTLSGAIVYNGKVIQVLHSYREYEGCEDFKFIEFSYEDVKVIDGKHAPITKEKWSYPSASRDVILVWNDVPKESTIIVSYEYVEEVKNESK